MQVRDLRILSALILGLLTQVPAQDPKALGQPGSELTNSLPERAPQAASLGTGAVPLEEAATQHNVGVFIGVGNFHPSSGVKNLAYTVNDAIALCHLFVIELKLIPANRAFLLISHRPEPGTRAARELEALIATRSVSISEATKVEIIDAVAKASATATEPEGLILVTASSHGFEKDKAVYVMPQDGRAGAFLLDMGVSLQRLEEVIAESPASKKVMIVDACRSEAKGTEGMTAAFREALANSAGMAVLVSCEKGQQSWEDPRLEQGAFTYFLVRALRGEAPPDPESNFITLGSASSWASTMTQDWVRKNRGAEQIPWSAGERGRRIPIAMDRSYFDELAKLRERKKEALAYLKASCDLDLDGNLADIGNSVKSAIEKSKDDQASRRLLSQVETLKLGTFESRENFREWWAQRGTSSPATPITVKSEVVAIPPQIEESADSKQFTLSTNPSHTMRFIRVPGGSFLMGAVTGDTEADEDERPARRVTVSSEFWLAETEVSVALFRSFVEAKKYRTVAERRLLESNWRSPGSEFPKGDDLPVVYIDSADVAPFCDWLKEQTGSTFRLPTEAELEYVMRLNSVGGLDNPSRYSWGDNFADGPAGANIADASLKSSGEDMKLASWDDGFPYLAPVKSPENAASRQGFYHLFGNVRELAQDKYRTDAYTVLPARDPLCSNWQQKVSSGFVARGADWSCSPVGSRISMRSRCTKPDWWTGFRLVLDTKK